jgi:hypothetical protein
LFAPQGKGVIVFMFSRVKIKKFHSIYTRSDDPKIWNKRGVEGVPTCSHGHKKLGVLLLLDYIK